MPLQGHCTRKCHTHYMQASLFRKPSHTHTHRARRPDLFYFFVTVGRLHATVVYVLCKEISDKTKA